MDLLLRRIRAGHGDITGVTSTLTEDAEKLSPRLSHILAPKILKNTQHQKCQNSNSIAFVLFKQLFNVNHAKGIFI